MLAVSPCQQQQQPAPCAHRHGHMQHSIARYVPRGTRDESNGRYAADRSRSACSAAATDRAVGRCRAQLRDVPTASCCAYGTSFAHYPFPPLAGPVPCSRPCVVQPALCRTAAAELFRDRSIYNTCECACALVPPHSRLSVWRTRAAAPSAWARRARARAWQSLARADRRACSHAVCRRTA